jgi:hypothetical protein
MNLSPPAFTQSRSQLEADARTRTGDPFITSEVLYQLSYVGAGLSLALGARGRRTRPAAR